MDPNSFQPTGPQVPNPVNPVIQAAPQPTVVDVSMPQSPQQPVFGPQPAQPMMTQQPQPTAQDFTQYSPVPGGVIQPGVQPGLPGAQPTTPVVGGPATQKKPKFLLIIIIAVVLLGGMTVAGVLLAPKKKVETKKTDTAQTTGSEGPQPAKALDVEQSNNSINQDISGLNDEDDFPPSQLEDKALGL